MTKIRVDKRLFSFFQSSFLHQIAAGILALLACGVCYMASKERKGEPLFAPKPASNPMRDDLEKA